MIGSFGSEHPLAARRRRYVGTPTERWRIVQAVGRPSICTNPKPFRRSRATASSGACCGTVWPQSPCCCCRWRGIAGYEYFEDLPWRDAFLNAAMLMGGMGPVDAPRTDGGKVFAGLYALYAGLVFLVASGLVFAPIAHRVLHRFHWERDR